MRSAGSGSPDGVAAFATEASDASPRAGRDPGGGAPGAGRAGRPLRAGPAPAPPPRRLGGAGRGRPRGSPPSAPVRCRAAVRAPIPSVRVPEPPALFGEAARPKRGPPPVAGTVHAPRALRRRGRGRGSGPWATDTRTGSPTSGRAAGMAHAGWTRKPRRRPQSRLPSQARREQRETPDPWEWGEAVAAASRRALWDDAPRGHAEPAGGCRAPLRVPSVRRSKGWRRRGGTPLRDRNRFPHPGARYLALSASLAARGRRWFKDLCGLRRPADAHEGAPGRAEGGPPRREGRLRTPMPPSVPPRRPPPAPPVHGKPRTERGYPASLSAWGPKGRGPSRLSSSPPHPPPPTRTPTPRSARGGRKGLGRGARWRRERGSACTWPRPPGPCEPSAWTEPEPSGSVCETFDL